MKTIMVYMSDKMLRQRVKALHDLYKKKTDPLPNTLHI